MINKLSKQKFIQAYCHLEGLDTLTLVEWNALVRVLRSRSLMASFYSRLINTHGKLNLLGEKRVIPEIFENAFFSSITFAKAQHIQTRTQGYKLAKLLTRSNIPFAFLKGAAYVLGNTRNAEGRLMTDIDICVNANDIEKAEKLLVSVGFKAKNLDEHDEKYYREWSHEIPPLINEIEGVALDVHHTFIPPVSGRNISIKNLIEKLLNVDNTFPIPPTEWLIFHSALHLVINEEVDNGLRDLTDIYLLLSTKVTHSQPEQVEGTEQTNTGIDAADIHTQTAQLFNEQKFQQEWCILNALLQEYFSYQHGEQKHHKLSLKSKVKLAVLKRAIIPNSEFITGSKYRTARLINYLMGYTSKMPTSILVKQFSYKLYRLCAKAIFGEYYFRPAKGEKGK